MAVFDVLQHNIHFDGTSWLSRFAVIAFGLGICSCAANKTPSSLSSSSCPFLCSGCRWKNTSKTSHQPDLCLPPKRFLQYQPPPHPHFPHTCHVRFFLLLIFSHSLLSFLPTANRLEITISLCLQFPLQSDSMLE